MGNEHEGERDQVSIKKEHEGVVRTRESCCGIDLKL